MSATQPEEGSLDQQQAGSSRVFVNRAFEASAEESSVAAELQAARLRLETADGERAALAEELATTRTRLHDALEVLEGVLSERSVLRRQALELQAQLAAALADQRESAAVSSPQGSTPAQPGSPSKQQLQRKLALAQAQLRELAAAQQAWEAERCQLLQEVEEERQRLQEGLAEALGQASTAQHEADAASERAAHWCSLAQVLQRSVLLSEGGASPSPLSPASTASTASRYSPPGAASSRYSPAAGSAAKPARAAPFSGVRSTSGSGAATNVSRLLAEFRSPLSSSNGPRTRSRLPASPGGDGTGAAAGAASQGQGLISAFQAVASTPGDKQLQGSPMLQRCAWPSPLHQQSPAAANPAGPVPAGSAGAASSLAASAELAPGTHLQLLHKLPNPGLSCASSPSLGGARTPLTPEPCGAAAGTAGAALDAHAGAGSTSVRASTSSITQISLSPTPPAKPRGLLGRLLLRGACAAGLPPAQGHVGPRASGRRPEAWLLARAR
ncbi:hypothetical protein ABPG75_000719 [Micractinium tetrahymenae]